MRIQFIKDCQKKSFKWIREGTEVECTVEKAKEYIDAGYALDLKDVPILPAHKRRSRRKKPKREIQTKNPDTGESIIVPEY